MRYHFEILSGAGGAFLRSVRAMTVAEIQADKALSRLFKVYRHLARTEAGEPLAEIPGIGQPAATPAA